MIPVRNVNEEPGGMGSLNDISISARTNPNVPAWKVTLGQSKLERLRSALFAEVKRLEARATESTD